MVFMVPPAVIGLDTACLASPGHNMLPEARVWEGLEGIQYLERSKRGTDEGERGCLSLWSLGKNVVRNRSQAILMHSDLYFSLSLSVVLSSSNFLPIGLLL